MPHGSESTPQENPVLAFRVGKCAGDLILSLQSLAAELAMRSALNLGEQFLASEEYESVGGSV